MNRFLLTLLSEVMEDESVTVSQLSEKLHKDPSYIIKSITTLKNHLPGQKYIIIKNNKFIKNFNYTYYIGYIKSLPLSCYTINIQERIEFTLASLTLNKVISKKSIYDAIHLSASTLKNDNGAIHEKVHSLSSKLKNHSKKGVELIGNELAIRINLVNILQNKLQINNSELIKNTNNSPLDNQICDLFFKNIQSIELQPPFDIHNLYYTSQKFILIYHYVTLIRRNMGMDIVSCVTPPCPLFRDIVENTALSSSISGVNYEMIYLSYIYDSLSLKDESCFVFNKYLLETTHKFINFLFEQQFIPTSNYELINNLYLLMKREHLRALIGIEINDNKVKTVSESYRNLHEQIKQFFNRVDQSKFSAMIDDMSISKIIITILFHCEKFKNYHNKKKKVVIVSNSTEQTLSLLLERLSSLYYVEIVDIVDSNEIEKLNTVDYDHLLCFTKKVKNRIETAGLQCHQIDFNLTDEELLKLKERLTLSFN